jgi:predicted  nucleic acid-binding Zn-ribbon protein
MKNLIKIKLSDINKEITNLLSELSKVKLEYRELETENIKCERTERQLRNNIAEMKISFDEMQHRFETRVGEYKTQLHLKEEKIANLKEHIRFQK